LITLPDSAAAFKDATWDDVQPYYEDLESRTLDRANVESWLAEWSLFESLLGEASALAYFAYTTNTADPRLEEAELRFSTEIAPKARERRTRLQARLVELAETRALAYSIMREVEAMAARLDIDLGISIEQRIAGAARVGHHKTSMLQDVESGRPMELEAIAGAVVELGQKLGIEVPHSQSVYACTKLLARNLQRRIRS